MRRKCIVFIAAGQVELQESDLRPLGDNEVLVANEFSAISAGTERACLLDLPNLADEPPGKFPKILGYSGVGRVVEVGKDVKSVHSGDRVLTYWGSNHSNYNYVREENVLVVKDDTLLSEHAVFAIIASFSLNGLRKTRLEIGESGAVVGLGILGLFAVALCRIAGGSPVIASDLSPVRRKKALELGANLAFDPAADDHIGQVKNAAGGGVDAVIEVTGQSVALQQALGFVARFGRISLLGCTRVSNTMIDYYQQVHRPGVEIVGAHAMVRPMVESHPHSWTWQDDVRALWRFMTDGRLDMSKVLSAVYAPQDAPAVYRNLAEHHHDFPVGAVFDWKQLP
ncbi:MAG: zinc-binding alcohol dehydrogenase [Kiritimatiellae bacterium]|nr:zinc-binding alcohol dehydrogenase [Kiritimatiellia bacterium]